MATKSATQKLTTPASAGKATPEDKATASVIKTTDAAGPAFQGSKTDEEVGKLPELVTPELIKESPAEKPKDTVSLKSPGGTKVTVGKNDADAMRALGYK